MLYLIGLGLNKKSISAEGLGIVKKCKQVYLENYTVNFPYSLVELEEVVGKKIIPVDREFIEGFSIIDEARKKDVALLIYGSPLSATTHISLINEAKNSETKTKIIYSGSVFDAVAETGLQLYKFGKITSIPAWKKNFTPTSFMEVVKENQSVQAHTLILADIGLEHLEALKEIKKGAEEHKINLDKIIICSCLGTPYSKIFYKNIDELEKLKEIKKPYCIIIPSKLHFIEEESLKNFEEIYFKKQ